MEIGTLEELASIAEKVHVGDVVKVQAVDWCMYTRVEPIERTYPFRIMRAIVYGEVIHVDHEGLTIAAETFEDGGLRGVRTYPIVTIEQVTILEKKE